MRQPSLAALATSDWIAFTAGLSVRVRRGTIPTRSAQHGDVASDEPDVTDLRDVRRRLVVREDRLQRRPDLGAPVHLAPVEADDVAVVVEQRGEAGRSRSFQRSSAVR
jgi:hypothetical protein